MSEHKLFLPTNLEEFTLFIDRDGVINKPIIDDYAKCPDDFLWCDGALEALGQLLQLFQKVILVTNQQGVHRNVMSEKDLEDVHLKLYNGLKSKGLGYFDASFFAPYLKELKHSWRKPNNGMLLKASSYFPDIDMNKAIMVGDSPGDMQLADTLSLVKVRIFNSQFTFDNQDYTFSSLSSFVLAASK
jgi:histidinol-phosphate phosphatase family protein